LAFPSRKRPRSIKRKYFLKLFEEKKNKKTGSNLRDSRRKVQKQMKK